MSPFPPARRSAYAYDDAKRVTGVQTTADGKTYRNAYTYEEDRIKTVSHNTTDNTATDVTYTFDYDDLGRKTTVKVGTADAFHERLRKRPQWPCFKRCSMATAAR